jgi:hypothetical protein
MTPEPGHAEAGLRFGGRSIEFILAPSGGWSSPPGWILSANAPGDPHGVRELSVTRPRASARPDNSFTDMSGDGRTTDGAWPRWRGGTVSKWMPLFLFFLSLMRSLAPMRLVSAR